MDSETRAPLPEIVRGRNILVFGAAGFIGRWVSRLLSLAGARLYLTARDVQSAKEIFSTYEVRGEIFEIDLQQLDSIGELIASIRPDVIFNLAGYGVDRSERNEDTAYRINASLIEMICLAMAGLGKSNWPGQQIIHAGSALEYGEISGNLAEDSGVNPTTLYGKSKLMGTQLLAARCRETGVRGLTARLFTVYGPGEHDGRLLPSLLKAAVDGQALALTAGQQRRDFTYVQDAAEGLIRLSATDSLPGEIVNLATGKLTSVRCFIETAASILNIPENRLHFGAIPTRNEEMQHDEVTVDRLQKLTNWAPRLSIEEGIFQTKNFA